MLSVENRAAQVARFTCGMGNRYHRNEREADQALRHQCTRMVRERLGTPFAFSAKSM